MKSTRAHAGKIALVFDTYSRASGGTDQSSIRAERRHQDRYLTAVVGPNMRPGRGNQALPVQPARRSQSAAHNQRLRIEHVDQPADTSTQRRASTIHDL